MHAAWPRLFDCHGAAGEHATEPVPVVESDNALAGVESIQGRPPRRPRHPIRPTPSGPGPTDRPSMSPPLICPPCLSVRSVRPIRPRSVLCVSCIMSVLSVLSAPILPIRLPGFLRPSHPCVRPRSGLSVHATSCASNLIRSDPPVCPSICPSFRLAVRPMCLRIRPAGHLSVRPSVCPSV